ncbi:DNA polymerase [Enterococcus phage SANTOR1]|uniref:DNA polymerase B-like protein n=1 Tax=Enterococcus phage SANTOR1 TaxID=1871692 RepID=A0A1B1PA19_9CAUD|nr:DNA polymerase [Enterococcus phage SANTOR1]ANT41000.1 DNA polymerase B-like protein [Enterococcus phage SANTOR1]
MKNIAEFKDAPELAEKLLEVFSNLKGNSRSLDPMRAGQHDVVVIESTEKLSAKGKEMKVVKLRSLEDGRDVTSYIMKFRKYDWDKWKNVEVGDRLLIDLKFSNGFATVKPIRTISKGNETPFKPSEPLTKQTILLFDIEIFKHDNLFVFRDYFTKEWFIINNDLDELRKFYLEYRDSMFIGYNNASYDNNVMRGYLQGKNAYQMSKTIIESDNRGLVYKMFDSHKTPLFGMDLYQDNKGFSLKEHSAFLGINIKETEVDFDMDRPLTGEEKDKNIAYCKNDVLATEKRFEQNISMLLAKATIALMFDMDKTDLLQTNANLTAKLLGATKQEVRPDLTDPLELDKRLNINTKEIAEAYLNHEFELNEKGKLNVSLNYTTEDGYEMVFGSGGVHGAVPSYIHIGLFPMRDWGSLYPNTMVQFNLLSRNIPKDKLHRYSDLLKQRMDAKYSGEETADIKGVEVPTWVMINGIKLPLNTKFGASGAEFNGLYDPRNQFLVCATGQLIMTNMYELIKGKAQFIQSNTDAHAYIPNSEADDKAIDEALDEFANKIGLTLDKDMFREIWQKDVNNYIAVQPNGKVKVKGAIGLTGGMKVSKAIVSNAFINYLVAGKDYKEFINECNELRQFQIITKTGWTFDRTVQRDINGNESEAQKVNRVFAVKDPSKAVELFKVKEGQLVDIEADEFKDNVSYTKGLANAPEYYTISNEAIGEGITIDEIDKQYYIEQVEDTLELWFGENYKERIEQAHHERELQGFKPVEVKNYID